MKKVILTLALGFFALSSCKKDYVCDCTVTRINSYDSDSETYTVKSTMKETSKKAVNQSGFCVSSVDEYTNEDVLVGYDTNFEPIYKDVTYTNTYDCKLSK